MAAAVVHPASFALRSIAGGNNRFYSRIDVHRVSQISLTFATFRLGGLRGSLSGLTSE
jgi:hypothetical protein